MVAHELDYGRVVTGCQRLENCLTKSLCQKNIGYLKGRMLCIIHPFNQIILYQAHKLVQLRNALASQHT